MICVYFVDFSRGRGILLLTHGVLSTQVNGAGVRGERVGVEVDVTAHDDVHLNMVHHGTVAEHHQIFSAGLQRRAHPKITRWCQRVQRQMYICLD